MGASRYTPWVCLPLSLFGSGAELPLGNAAHTAPQIKTQYSQYSQYSQSAPPAGHSKPQRLCRILVQKITTWGYGSGARVATGVCFACLMAAGVCVLRGRDA